MSRMKMVTKCEKSSSRRKICLAWLVGGAGGRAGPVPGVNSERCTSDITRNTRCLQWVIPVVFVLNMFD